MVHAAVQESRQPVLRLLESWSGDEFVNTMPNEIVKIFAKDFSEAAVYDSNLAIERNGENGLIEAIDQLAVVVLGTRDDVYELFDLLLTGGRGAERQLRLCRGIGHDEVPLSGGFCYWKAPLAQDSPPGILQAGQHSV